MDTAAARTAAAVETAITAADQTILGVSLGSGIARSTLNRRLKSKGRSPFKIDELEAISGFLNIPLVNLLGEDAA